MLYHWFFFSLFVFRLKWPCLLKIRCELIFQYFETWVWLVNDFLFPLHCIFSSILLHYKERSNHYCKEEWSRVEMKMAKKGVCNWVKVAWCYKFNLIDRFIILYGNNPLMKVQIRYYSVSQQVLVIKFLQNQNFETCQKNSSNRWEICTV